MNAASGHYFGICSQHGGDPSAGGPPASLHDLKERHRKALAQSETVSLRHAQAYRQLKAAVADILSRPVDISEYAAIARHLSRLLESLAGSGKPTVFDYFFRHIDPDQRGDVRFLRALCQDLADQLDQLDRQRRRHHRLRLVSSAATPPWRSAPGTPPHTVP